MSGRELTPEQARPRAAPAPAPAPALAPAPAPALAPAARRGLGRWPGACSLRQHEHLRAQP